MVEPTPWTRNARAALALAGVTVDDAARQLNISRKTLERTLRGERAPRQWESERLSEVLSVPLWFLERGLADLGDQSVLIERARKAAEAFGVELLKIAARPSTDVQRPISETH
jgi:transcriptional regulator with XRE-family HTH domain